MASKARCIELRTPKDEVILKLYLYDKETDAKGGQKSQANDKTEMQQKEKAQIQTGKEKDNGKDKAQTSVAQPDEPMTEAQKRYLFRILADQGINGDGAHQCLKDRFQVESLKEVSKQEASRMIESLLTEAKGKGGEEHGAPL